MTKNTEPAITIGGVSAGIAAIIALLVAFGIPITEDQQIAILGVVAAVGPIVTAIITRRFVVPTGAVAEELDGYSDSEAEASDEDHEQTHRADV